MKRSTIITIAVFGILGIGGLYVYSKLKEQQLAAKKANKTAPTLWNTLGSILGLGPRTTQGGAGTGQGSTGGGLWNDIWHLFGGGGSTSGSGASSGETQAETTQRLIDERNAQYDDSGGDYSTDDPFYYV